MLRDSLPAVCIGFFLDLLLGDPEGWPHIIRLAGKWISFLEKRLYPMKKKRTAGLLLVIFTLIPFSVCPFLLLFLCREISGWLFILADSVLIWQLLAVKSLKTESKKVYSALSAGDLSEARKAVSMIVGRDTQNLTSEGVSKAAVETVAENTSDGVIAPLFYILIGGGTLGLIYKTVNTLDSMVGYRNEKYLDFGRASAKLDDILNYLPSRLCALLMIASSFLCRLDFKNARRIWKRDRRKHASPNSAQTEAAMAGALDIQLGGDADYFGIRCKKPLLGDEIRKTKPEDILQAHRILICTSFLMMILVCLIRGCFLAIL